LRRTALRGEDATMRDVIEVVIDIPRAAVSSRNKYEIYRHLEPGKSSSTAGFEGLAVAHREIVDTRVGAC
jgi:hypothetical protein